MEKFNFESEFEQATKDLPEWQQEMLLLITAVKFMPPDEALYSTVIGRLKHIATAAHKWDAFTKGNGGAE